MTHDILVSRQNRVMGNDLTFQSTCLAAFAPSIILLEASDPSLS
jgi:hypothetical protein